VEVDVSGLAADALGARRAGDLAFAAQRWVDDVIVVADEVVADAQRRLWAALRLATEPAGAAALAALTVGALPDPDERVAVVLCGANVDPGKVA
jgi:threonine dehydratase